MVNVERMNLLYGAHEVVFILTHPFSQVFIQVNVDYLTSPVWRNYSLGNRKMHCFIKEEHESHKMLTLEPVTGSHNLVGGGPTSEMASHWDRSFEAS